MSTTHKQLLKRISDLVNRNRVLRLENDRLFSQNENLSQEVEEKDREMKFSNAENADKKPKQAFRVHKFRMATVLYAEAVGFGQISDEMDAGIIADNLEDIFEQFDNIIQKYGIVKVKSFGDSIMCAGGVPVKNSVNPIEVLRCAVEIQYYIKEFQKTYKNNKIWKFKIGVHTGPLMVTEESGKKQYFEVKGDSANIAARARAFAQPGEIFITENTFEMVKELFNCNYFGKMPVKYRGDMKIYQVEGLLPDYSIHHRGIIPNKAFINQFRLIQFTDLQEHILDKLENELPDKLYYHNVKHTVDVVTQAELIGWGEGVDEENILLLKTAALFHDTGHITGYDDHEHHSTVLAREVLPVYYYNQTQIDTVCELIMATKLPPNPKDIFEQIICDSDLDYLGRSDMIPVSNELFKELSERNKIDTLDDWNKLQIQFITNHRFFTKTARTLREVNKKKQIERISKLIEN